MYIQFFRVGVNRLIIINNLQTLQNFINFEGSANIKPQIL